MKVLFIGILTILLTGCSTTKYVYQPIPKPIDKPIFIDYNITYNNHKYILEEYDALILSINWSQYKEWAETNYKILNNLYKNSLKVIK